MIITGIEAFPMRLPVKAGSQSDTFACADARLRCTHSLLVKLTIDTGLEGWGEAFGFRAVAAAKLAVNELITPRCIGQDATWIRPLMLEVHDQGKAGFGAQGPGLASTRFPMLSKLTEVNRS